LQKEVGNKNNVQKNEIELSAPFFLCCKWEWNLYTGLV